MPNNWTALYGTLDKFEEEFCVLKAYGVEILLVHPIWSLDLIDCPLVEEQVAGFDVNVIDINISADFCVLNWWTTARIWVALNILLGNTYIQVATFHEYYF